MLGCALPSRPGATPVDERVLGLVDEAGQRRPEQRDVDALAARQDRVAGEVRAPAPLAGPPSSAASTLTAPSIPVATSLIATPTLVGLPPSASGAPVMLIRPLVAWMTKS